MNRPLFLQNGDIVLENSIAKGDVLLQNGKISLISVEPGISSASGKPVISASCRQQGISPSALPDGVEVVDISGCYLCPGFIDLHVHGGGGGDFLDPASINLATAFHSSRGTTGLLATVASGPLPDMLSQIETLRKAVVLQEQGTAGTGARILGIHLEGPYLNPEQSGALQEQSFRRPSLKEAIKIMEIAGPDLKMITLAPELEGAPELIRFFSSRSVRVSAGHSLAGWAAMETAFNCGLTHGTHFGNRMGQLHQREPGVTGSLLARLGVTIDIIADGLHLHPGFIKIVLDNKGLDRIMLISDALPLAGLPGGNYRWLEQDIAVAKGSACLSGGHLAGGTGALVDGLRNMAGWFNLTLPQAVRLVSRNPGRFLGLAGLGIITPGAEADLVILDRSFEVKYTIIAGQIFR